MAHSRGRPDQGGSEALSKHDPQERARRSLEGLGNLLERTAPWLFEVGTWIFGGLIAFDIVIIGSLLTVGPVDRAIVISTTTLAAALPLNVAGIFLLRLVSDAKDIHLDEVALGAFKDAGFPDIEAYFPASGERETVRRNGAAVALRWAFGIAALSIVLTVAGLAAALWHMAWWIGAVLLAVIVMSGFLVFAVIARAWPAESAAEHRIRRRLRRRREHHESVS